MPRPTEQAGSLPRPALPEDQDEDQDSVRIRPGRLIPRGFAVPDAMPWTRSAASASEQLDV